MLHILNIAGISDKAEEYADKFLKLCENEALAAVIQALPADQQQQLQQKLAGVTDKTIIQTTISQYVTDEQYNTVLEKSSQTLFQQFMDSLLPTLSQEQATNLQGYIQTLQPPTP